MQERTAKFRLPSAPKWLNPSARYQRQLQLLILQATPFCNLDCSYCYLPHRDNKEKLHPDTAVKAVQWVIENRLAGRQFTVVWHAGEPLAAGVDLYQQACGRIQLLQTPDLQISHAVQTNATLINEQWCALFQQYAFTVGVSLDGPRELHDLHRHYRNGNGSFDAVMEGIRQLQQHEIPFHIIAVITRDSLERADEIFDFFVQLGVRQIGFNIEEIEQTNTKSSLTGTSKEQLQHFYARLHRKNLEAGLPLSIRELDGALAAISQWRKHAPAISTQENSPFALVNVDYRGRFSTYSPELLGAQTQWGEFYLGNINSTSLADCIKSPLFRNVEREINLGVRNCESHCPMYKLCGGGSPSNKWYEHNKFNCSETLYCQLNRQAPLEVVMLEIESLQEVPDL